MPPGQASLGPRRPPSGGHANPRGRENACGRVWHLCTNPMVLFRPAFYYRPRSLFAKPPWPSTRVSARNTPSAVELLKLGCVCKSPGVLWAGLLLSGSKWAPEAAILTSPPPTPGYSRCQREMHLGQGTPRDSVPTGGVSLLLLGVCSLLPSLPVSFFIFSVLKTLFLFSPLS